MKNTNLSIQDLYFAADANPELLKEVCINTETLGLLFIDYWEEAKDSKTFNEATARMLEAAFNNGEITVKNKFFVYTPKEKWASLFIS